MTKIYVIIKDTGDYSDREVTVLRAVSSEERAQQLVLELNIESRKDDVIIQMCGQYRNDYIKNVKKNCLPDYGTDPEGDRKYCEDINEAVETYRNSIDRDSITSFPPTIHYDTSFYYEELELED